jgi:hypothetical protein
VGDFRAARFQVQVDTVAQDLRDDARLDDCGNVQITW